VNIVDCKIMSGLTLHTTFIEPLWDMKILVPIGLGLFGAPLGAPLGRRGWPNMFETDLRQAVIKLIVHSRIGRQEETWSTALVRVMLPTDFADAMPVNWTTMPHGAFGPWLRNLHTRLEIALVDFLDDKFRDATRGLDLGSGDHLWETVLERQLDLPDPTFVNAWVPSFTLRMIV
jgi:hypothetical protein